MWAAWGTLIEKRDYLPGLMREMVALTREREMCIRDSINEALALGIDQHSAVAAQTLGDQSSGVSLHGGVDLDLIHIHGVSTDGLCHLDALAQDAGGVGGHKALQLGLVLNLSLIHISLGKEPLRSVIL